MRRLNALQKWAAIGFGIYVVAALGMLLLPLSYSRIVHAMWGWLRVSFDVPFGAGWVEFAANVVLFVPMGFLLTLVFRHPWYGTILAVVLSAGVEIAQIVIPSRQPTLRDIVSNSIGAALGALVAWLVVVRRRRDTKASDPASAGVVAPGPVREE